MHGAYETARPKVVRPLAKGSYIPLAMMYPVGDNGCLSYYKRWTTRRMPKKLAFVMKIVTDALGVFRPTRPC